MQRIINVGVFGVVVVSYLLAGCGGSNAGTTPVAPTASSAASSATAGPTVCATFYADAHLQGATLVSNGPTDNAATIPASFNDTMSSVAVTPGCTVIAYPDGNFGGQAVTFTQNVDTVPASINDQMSSYKCTCGSGAAN